MFDTIALICIALTYIALIFGLHLIECARKQWRFMALEGQSTIRMKQEEIDYLKVRIKDMEKVHE